MHMKGIHHRTSPIAGTQGTMEGAGDGPSFEIYGLFGALLKADRQALTSYKCEAVVDDFQRRERQTLRRLMRGSDTM